MNIAKPVNEKTWSAVIACARDDCEGLRDYHTWEFTARKWSTITPEVMIDDWLASCKSV